ncbi:MAG: hypothetical protein GY943_07895 [Chloroflexi bacterium]|nr:hypothetical protein [Chloroflexota bacterium]
MDTNTRRNNQFRDNERIAILYHPDNLDEAWVADVVQNWSPWDGVWVAAILVSIGVVALIAAIVNLNETWIFRL